jgi:plastocyanin
MRRLLLLLTAVFALAAAAPVSAATTAVRITGTGFAPKTVYVSAGDTITWTNSTTSSQQVVANDGSFSSPTLAAGQSYSHTFDTAGAFAYHNGLHPARTGTVNVNAHAQVTIINGGFEPPTVNVTAGETVTWTNRGTSNHQVVSDDGTFSSPVLAPGQTYQHTFVVPGTSNYHDGLNASNKGSVVVAAAPAPDTITLFASHTTVISGAAVKLSGTVSTQKAGETVAIVATSFSGASRTITVTSGNGGAFAAVVAPGIGTSYRAFLKGAAGVDRASSSAVNVSVRPRVTLRKVAATRFSSVVVSGRSLAGRIVSLAEFSPRTHRWITIRRAVLRRSSSTVSVGSFSVRIRHGLKLRAIVASPGGGYLAGYSNFILS